MQLTDDGKAEGGRERNRQLWPMIRRAQPRAWH